MSGPLSIVQCPDVLGHKFSLPLHVDFIYRVNWILNNWKSLKQIENDKWRKKEEGTMLEEGVNLFLRHF